MEMLHLPRNQWSTRIVTLFVVSAWFLIIVFSAVSSNEVQHQQQRRQKHYIGGRYRYTQHDYANIERIYSKTRNESDNISHSSEECINVCFTSDRNTLIGAIAAMNSVRQNTKKRIRYHFVVESDIFNHAKAWLSRSVLRNEEYRVISFDISILKGKIKVRSGRAELSKPMNHARFLYPELLGPEVKGKIVHLDDDVIVQGDIADLTRVEFKGNINAAFSEDCKSDTEGDKYKFRYVNYLNFNNNHIRELNLEKKACSFNTGIFVTDINAWRKYNLSKQLLFWTELNTREDLYGNRRGGGGSQPPMMIVFYKKYTPIDPLWHVRNLGSIEEIPAALVKRAKLLHWSGPNKPWSSTAQFKEIWDKYYVPDPDSKYRLTRTHS